MRQTLVESWFQCWNNWDAHVGSSSQHILPQFWGRITWVLISLVNKSYASYFFFLFLLRASRRDVLLPYFELEMLSLMLAFIDEVFRHFWMYSSWVSIWTSISSIKSSFLRSFWFHCWDDDESMHRPLKISALWWRGALAWWGSFFVRLSPKWGVLTLGSTILNIGLMFELLGSHWDGSK